MRPQPLVPELPMHSAGKHRRYGWLAWLLLALTGCGAAENAAIVAGLKQELDPRQLEVGDPIVNSAGMVLVPIPSGQFLMGSPNADSDADESEKPQHSVDIVAPFYLGAFEVTQRQYAEVTGKDPSFFQGADHLVDTVSWRDAVAFCRSLSELPEEREAGRTYRLPSEAEWEYACRAGATTRYSFGDDQHDLEDYAWFCKNSAGRTHPVGRKRTNSWGLHDMPGNVWEWCQDGDNPRAYDGDRPADDPRGPAEGDGHVERGGAFTNPPSSLRSAARFGASPNFRLFSSGFRVAATITR